jgi:hypothetical protein
VSEASDWSLAIHFGPIEANRSGHCCQDLGSIASTYDPRSVHIDPFPRGLDAAQNRVTHSCGECRLAEYRAGFIEHLIINRAFRERHAIACELMDTVNPVPTELHTSSTIKKRLREVKV